MAKHQLIYPLSGDALVARTKLEAEMITRDCWGILNELEQDQVAWLFPHAQSGRHEPLEAAPF